MTAFFLEVMRVVSYAHMHMTKKRWGIAGVIALVILAGGWLFYTNVVSPSFPINSKDTIASWSFKGAYTGNATLVEQANADIAKLQGLLGKGQYDDYDLYIGMGNDYSLVGEGTAAYQNYNRAAMMHPDKGLAFANMAHLMEQLGAPYTAVDAHAQAVAAEPGQLQYHIGRLNYLVHQFPSESELMNAAFADARAQFGDTKQMLAIEADWYTSLGKYADAIAVWERAKKLVTGADASAIAAEIARLKAK